jgi:hypothetical protein
LHGNLPEEYAAIRVGSWKVRARSYLRTLQYLLGSNMEWNVIRKVREFPEASNS